MEIPKRKRLRLQGYDNSQNGAYFVTICSDGREKIFGDIVGAIKSILTKKANEMNQIKGRKIWRFRFHDHMICNEQEYLKIWKYIDENPLKWEIDCFYGENI